MPVRVIGTVLLAALAFTPPALAQQKYDIRFKKSVQGQVELIQSNETDEAETTLLDKEGNVVELLEKKKKTVVYNQRMEILEKAPGARWSSKFRVNYMKAEETDAE